MKEQWTHITAALRTRLVNALKIIAPVLILLYLLKAVAEPVQTFLGGFAVLIGGLVSIPPVVAGSKVSCLLLAALLLLGVGQAFATKRGRQAIVFCDQMASRFALYKAVRNLVKLPRQTAVGADGATTPDAESEVVWFFSSGAWAVVPVKEHWVHPDDSSQWMSIYIPSVPMPTGWSVRQIKAAWTAPAGLNWGVWMFWQARAGGVLPDGALPPPVLPPEEFRMVLASTTT